jgi:DNA repair protein RadD
MGDKMKKLRPHQELAVEETRAAFQLGHKRIMVQACTGWGKTLFACYIIMLARAKGSTVLFVVPAISLINQTVEAFEAEGIDPADIGVIQGNHERTNCECPIQICSIQTLQRRRIKPNAEFVIIDEAHRWFKFLEQWFEDWNAVPFLGLSATPWTKGLGKHYQDLVIAGTTEDMIEQGYLSPFRVFAPSSPDLSKVRTVAGDYHEGDLSEAMDTNTLVADVVQTWLDRAENRPTLVYGVDCAHAKHLQECFIAAGVNAAYMDAYTKLPDREVIGRQFAAGEVQVVCNVGVLTTGIDWDVRCISLVRPTKSEILFTQIIGRGLRTADGKDDCLILDHSSTHANLGFVTDINHQTLSTGKIAKSGEQEKEEKLPKLCGECQFLKPAGVHTCPNCGFAPTKQTEVVHESGELVEFSPASVKKRNKKTPKPDKQVFYSEMLYMAKELNYSQGWAAHAYRKQFGVWPNAMEKKVSTHAGADTRSFVKYMQITNALRKKA